jgi:hypothetical protein
MRAGSVLRRDALSFEEFWPQREELKNKRIFLPFEEKPLEGQQSVLLVSEAPWKELYGTFRALFNCSESLVNQIIEEILRLVAEDLSALLALCCVSKTGQALVSQLAACFFQHSWKDVQPVITGRELSCVIFGSSDQRLVIRPDGVFCIFSQHRSRASMGRWTDMAVIVGKWKTVSRGERIPHAKLGRFPTTLELVPTTAYRREESERYAMSEHASMQQHLKAKESGRDLSSRTTYKYEEYPVSSGTFYQLILDCQSGDLPAELGGGVVICAQLVGTGPETRNPFAECQKQWCRPEAPWNGTTLLVRPAVDISETLKFDEKVWFGPDQGKEWSATARKRFDCLPERAKAWAEGVRKGLFEEDCEELLLVSLLAELLPQTSGYGQEKKHGLEMAQDQLVWWLKPRSRFLIRNMLEQGIGK